jgi:hypothetical protein
MARVKIRGRKDAIEIEDSRARQIKVLRFGRPDGTGKADPHDDLDLGDDWAGMLGQVDWIELDRVVKPSQTKAVQVNATRTVKIVPIDYTLQEGESLI